MHDLNSSPCAAVYKIDTNGNLEIIVQKDRTEVKNKEARIERTVRRLFGFCVKVVLDFYVSKLLLKGILPISFFTAL